MASVAAAAVSFGAADVIGGSGFLAVYLVGLAVGSTPSRHRRQLVAFHEGLAFLAQVAMFVVLGLLVFPHDLPAVVLPGLALASLLVFLIRPAAVWVSTAFNDFTARERALLGWAGLRGAVPIVLGTIVLSSGIESGETIFNAVFFVVVVSALVQGTTLEWVAERLRLAVPAPAQAPLEVDAHSPLELVDFDVSPTHSIAGAAVRELGLPRSALVAAVARGTGLDPAARKHGDPGRRPPLRAHPADDAGRPGGRVRALAAPCLAPVCEPLDGSLGSITHTDGVPSTSSRPGDAR